MIPSPFGLKVYECPWMTVREQVRFPRSKKRRIRKKWAKQQRNYGQVPSSEVILLADAVHMHPATLQKFRRKLNKENSDE